MKGPGRGRRVRGSVAVQAGLYRAIFGKSSLVGHKPTGERSRKDRVVLMSPCLAAEAKFGQKRAGQPEL